MGIISTVILFIVYKTAKYQYKQREVKPLNQKKKVRFEALLVTPHGKNTEIENVWCSFLQEIYDNFPKDIYIN